MEHITLPALYLPPISWFHFLLHEKKEISIEQYENIPKQTLRNRCQIYGANGLLNLSIPLKKNGKRAMKDIEISYNQDWQKIHWKSIKNVYQSSPYFEYYEDKLKEIYQSTETNLLAFNLQTIDKILQLLKTEKIYTLTQKYNPNTTGTDLRNSFQSKKESDYVLPTYYQVFTEKFGFLSDLSILDLICNLGPESVAYIKKLNLK